MIDRLIDQGHFIGVGKSTFRDSSRVMKSLSEISLDHILLETDDMDIDISQFMKRLPRVKM